jgi:uncharacterized protein (TIGR00297 family)
MSEVLLLGLSYGYIFLFILLAGWLSGSGRLLPRTTRKVVHIGVAHWWLILMFGLHTPLLAVAGPVSFVVMNLVSLRYQLFKGMEAEPGSRNYGTVYFPVTLVVLVSLVNAGVIQPWEGGLGVLVMGWGDGLAAVIGSRARGGVFQVFGSTKSLLGSATMLVASFVVALVFLRLFLPETGLASLVLRAAGVAVFATLVELMTPFGVDNLTVPLLTTLYLHLAVVRAPDPDGLALALLGGFALNAVVAVAALRARAVKSSGAVAGVAVGTALLAAGGPAAYSLLMAFFLSSTIIGRFTRRRRPDSGIEEKGDRRDSFQVIANCGAATLSLVLYAALGTPAFLVAFAAGFAEANADTWASEIGILNARPPRHLFSWQPLPAGTSGGVSPLGTAAAVLGSALIALVFVSVFGSALRPGGSWAGVLEVSTLVLGGGILGSLVDSALGAGVQAQYRCSETGRVTERPHTGGVPNPLIKGIRWINNDAVNFLAASTAAGVAGVTFAWLHR